MEAWSLSLVLDIRPTAQDDGTKEGEDRDYKD
jgi:hypothetical protein